ncbi:MAG: hypothetical protein ACJA2E_000527 [Arenicella sp.]|jgi:hypothetical protein
MISILNSPREYPVFYEPYYDRFDFYNGRDVWEESIASIPKTAVHLYAIHWLHLEAHNGGFWQYFHNSTSNSFPEAVEGFSAVGMPEVALVIEQASRKLGNPFPFEKNKRQKIVEPPQNRLDFSQLDDTFYELADTEKFFRKKPKFVQYADAYARSAQQEAVVRTQ